MVDKVRIIEDEGEPIGFEVNGKEFYSEGAEWRIDVQVSELNGFNISSIPDCFSLYPLDGITIVLEGEISSDNEHVGIANMDLDFYRTYWDHKFGVTQYAMAMKKAVEMRDETNKDVEFVEIEDEGKHIFFRYNIFLNQDMPIDKAYQRFQEIIKEIEGHTERILEGEEISGEVLRDEPNFTIELLLPLFRNMGFIDVKYNHSKREFGKDVTFSKIDEFGVRRNYGVQVKAGDLSGEAGAEIDKIIAQIDDAFKMSYIDTTSKETRFISDLIVAISGRFSNNAEDKIIGKVPQRNIYFLSIDKIQELLTRYMKKKLK